MYKLTISKKPAYIFISESIGTPLIRLENRTPTKNGGKRLPSKIDQSHVFFHFEDSSFPLNSNATPRAINASNKTTNGK